MEMKTIKVDLGGGHWAELYEQVKRKTARLHEDEIRKHFRPLETDPLLMSELSSGQKPWPSDFVINPEAVDQSRIADIYALYQTARWSFGEVCQDVLDDMPRDQFKALKLAIDEAYEVDPLARSGGDSSPS
jgi:hypothetical protein